MQLCHYVWIGATTKAHVFKAWYVVGRKKKKTLEK